MDYQDFYTTIRRKMMQGNLSINSRFPGPLEFYPSILQVSIIHQDDQLTNYLLEHNADVNLTIKWRETDAIDISEKAYIRNKYGKSPLDSAIKIRNHKLVNKLITFGAYIPQQDKCHNILNAVTEEGNYEMAESLINLGFNINYKSIVTGETPLHTSVRLNRRDLVELMIQKRADINAKTISSVIFDDIGSNETEGLTPLHLAIIDKNQDMVRILLKNGAEFDELAISLAKSNKFFELIKIVASINDEKTDLSKNGAEFIWAVDKEYLIEKGANVNEIQHLYTTPLHLAISQKYNEAAKFLIDNGATLYHTNDHIDTLRLAIDMNNHEIIEYIIGNERDNFIFRASLQWAMERNNIEVSKFLISKCPNVNFVFGRETPLHRAVMNDTLELVKYLVKKGAKVNKIIDGETPLIISIHLTRNEIAKYLIDHGADVDFNYNGITPLLFAIGKNNIDVAKYLIQHGSDLSALVNITQYFGIERFFGWSSSDVSSYNFCNGRSALTLSIDLGRNEIVKFLINKVNLKSPENKAALYLAIKNGETEIAELLINKEADINYIYQDPKGSSIGIPPLILAICKRNNLIVKCLLEKGVNINAICKDEELLILATLYENEELVEYYINKSFNVNIIVSLQDTYLRGIDYSSREVKGSDIYAILNRATALDAAIHTGNAKIFDLLINGGAVIAKNVHHKNPLRFAVKNNYRHIVEYLIQNGADINRIEDDKSLLMEAVYCEHSEAVELLLKNKADVNLKTKLKITALDVAISQKNYLIMEILVEFGAVSLRYNFMDKPILYLAIEDRSYHHAIALIKRGADVNVVYKNKTLLHVALVKGNSDVINYLLVAGFDVNYLDKDDSSAVNYQCPVYQYYEDDYNFGEEINYNEIVKEHIVKLIIADFYVCKQNKLAVGCDFEQLSVECTKEVELMKKTFVVPRVKISYYDLLHKLDFKLAERFRFVYRSDEKKISSVVDNIRFLFVHYRGIVYFRAKKIFTMARSLVQVEDLIMDIFGGVLEEDMVPEITKYLSMEDVNIICR
ncbi:hypothetical protein KQX54_005990 [Cotesia glomerata]|uniref:Ankyrin repeat protein n=1 Tax=Cotesia glomerata TaxID=32391 RepID=A0AAV7IIV2_COTGL|nr:hypothetical protein KQX54_005990 [Cotesia glomerata]